MAPGDPPFGIRKIGHVVLRVTDLARSVDFYTRVLGFRVSDVYPEEMMPGGMVFMRFGVDHHGVALVGGMEGPSQGRELHHFAFEVATLDEVFLARRHLRAHGVPITFEGRRRGAAEGAVGLGAHAGGSNRPAGAGPACGAVRLVAEGEETMKKERR